MLRTLHDNWTLRPVGGTAPPDVAAAGPIPATVPGVVHTDLLAAGLIPDPYLDDNERRLAWIGLVDWCYETTFVWTPDPFDAVELAFDGLDTVARIELNGREIGTTYNMHRSYRFDVKDDLVAGANELSVTFSSALRFADRASLELGARPHVNQHPYNAIRKMACNFGWDWGPDLVTAGIWRPVSLHSWNRARLSSVRPVVTVEGTQGLADVHIELDRSDAGEDLVVSLVVGDLTVSRPLAAGERAVMVRATVDDVRRWWPRGHGEPDRYDISVCVHAAGRADEPFDDWHGRIGFRTARIDVHAEDQGTGVAFVVNDRALFIKGANWIPDDAFPHRVSRDRYSARLAQAEEAGINLLRVWGGGIYEADDFYDECDRRGIMVWQDFLFACAAYSEEEPLRSEVLAEARDNVTRLMPHPSLVVWNGNNENIWGFADWQWEARLDGRSWGDGYYQDLLPAIVAELDPGRAYTAGSPWSWSTDHHPNDAAHGTMHIWDVWNQLDYPAYRSHRPRFVAEFGWQGPPAWSTLRRALSDDPLTPESPGMLVHQKAADGNVKLSGGLVRHLPVPDTMDEWHWAMSLNQARAVQTGVEYFRSLSPYCTGSIVWQLNDCWPVVSWAAVDGDGRRKPVLYALRHAHADRLVTVQPADDGLHVAVVNDTAESWVGTLRLDRRNHDGQVLSWLPVECDVPSWSTQRVAVPASLATTANPATEVLVAELTDQRAVWSFVEDRDAALPAPKLEASVEAGPGGYLVTVTANSFIRDLTLLVDKVDPEAVVDDMLLTLFPGETVVLTVTCATPLDPGRLLDPTVLRSANQLVHRGPTDHTP